VPPIPVHRRKARRAAGSSGTIEPVRKQEPCRCWLPIIAAALLTEHPVTADHNVPRISSRH